MNKNLAVLLILIMVASSIMTVKAASASIPKPSVPEFTLKYVDNSYDVPPQYEINQYTGKSEVTDQGYHVQNKSVEVTITNQAFTSYNNENNSVVGLYYSVYSRGHFSQWQWTSDGDISRGDYIYLSDSPVTVVTLRLDQDFPDDGQIDVKVRALIGYYTQIANTPSPADVFSHGEPGYYKVFTGQASDWSPVQTIKIGPGTVTTAPEASSVPTSTSTPIESALPTQTPTATAITPSFGSSAFGLGVLEGAGLVLVGVVVGIALSVAFRFFRKRENN